MRASNRIAKFARHHLRKHLTRSGEILYSGASTLRSGQVYLLGHNPGGDPKNSKLLTLGRSLDDLPSKKTNSYLDTLWSRQRAVGQAPLQRRVVWLLKSLGLEPRDVAASNLIFLRSRGAAESQFRELSKACWPVHERIIDVVQPQLVIVFGNSGQSPFGFLLRKFGADVDEYCSSGHGNWVCRSFLAPGRFRVVGLPHLSRYDVSAHPAVVTWIKRLRKLALPNTQMEPTRQTSRTIPSPRRAAHLQR